MATGTARRGGSASRGAAAAHERGPRPTVAWAYRLQLADELDGKETAVLHKARETKGEASEMMSTYLGVNHSFATAAGGAISTADNLGTWIRALVRGRVLNHRYQRLWRASPRPTGQAGMDYGFGINRLHWGPNSLYLHGGETVGYNSEAAYDPENKLTLVVWANLTLSPSEELTANRLMLNVLDRAYKLSPLAPGAVEPQPADPGTD